MRPFKTATFEHRWNHERGGAEVLIKEDWEDSMEWISVDDRLPKDYERCLNINKFNGKYSDVFVGYVVHHGDSAWWMDDDGHFSLYVTHWMPLPSPPTA